MAIEKLTQADVRRMMDIIAMGGDALTDNLDLSLELMSMIERSGIIEAHKACKEEISKHPEVDYTSHGVTIVTTAKPEYSLNLQAIGRDALMLRKYEVALQQKREKVEVGVTDMGLRATRASDLKYLTKRLNDSWKVAVKKSKA